MCHEYGDCCCLPAFFLSTFIGKIATKSSPYGGHYPAEFGNDGDLTTFFHTTEDDYGSWWRVDLKLSYCVQAVNLINRQFRKN